MSTIDQPRPTEIVGIVATKDDRAIMFVASLGKDLFKIIGSACAGFTIATNISPTFQAAIVGTVLGGIVGVTISN